MRWPFTPFKTDSHFNQAVSYGPHEGLDINGLGGGNTDCGTPLYPLTDGEIVHTSESNADYGNLLVIEITGPWGTRWVRYAHCQSFLKKSGRCSEKEPVALMGSTGNSTACHLHFDILKKKPSKWRFYTKDKALFAEYFEDPKAFIEKWADYQAIAPVDCLLPNTESNRKLYENLIGAAEKINKLAKYLGFGDNADGVGYDRFEQAFAAEKKKADDLSDSVKEHISQKKVLDAALKAADDSIDGLKTELERTRESLIVCEKELLKKEEGVLDPKQEIKRFSSAVLFEELLNRLVQPIKDFIEEVKK